MFNGNRYAERERKKKRPHKNMICGFTASSAKGISVETLENVAPPRERKKVRGFEILLYAPPTLF